MGVPPGIRAPSANRPKGIRHIPFENRKAVELYLVRDSAISMPMLSKYGQG
ncbi:hypothetical protein DESC_190094 [Desulfosarcina cetonica]|nr:hypothetical protein DESC_190094 [Desulfosarcina cetonica]